MFCGEVGELAGVGLLVVEADDFAGRWVVGFVAVPAGAAAGGVDQFPTIPEERGFFVFEVFAEDLLAGRVREEVAAVGLGKAFRVEEAQERGSDVDVFGALLDHLARRDLAGEAHQ